MKERKSTTIKKQNALKGLAMAGGNVTIACEKAGIARSTFYKWQEEDEGFAASVESVYTGIVSYAEDQLILKAIQRTPELFIKRFQDRSEKLKSIKINSNFL